MSFLLRSGFVRWNFSHHIRENGFFIFLKGIQSAHIQNRWDSWEMVMQGKYSRPFISRWY